MLTLKNLFTALKCLASLGTVLALSACASMTGGDFSCPAPDGFRCMNPVEVYEATNHTSNLDEVSESKMAGSRKLLSRSSCSQWQLQRLRQPPSDPIVAAIQC